MGRSGLDDPEKDPSLFPESRVRPWVLDEAAELEVRDMRDDFERTLTSVSPLKEGLGESPLDRILPDDQRGRMFFEELARLQAEKVASDERKASRTCVLRPMGEVFEDLYRQTYGLPPRTKHKPEMICNAVGLPNEESIHATTEGTSESERERQDLESTEVETTGDDELAEDPDVARLVDLLHKDLDSDSCTDSEAGTDIGSSQDSDDSGAESRVKDENDDECGRGARDGKGRSTGRWKLGDLEHDASEERLVSGDAEDGQADERESRRATKDRQEEPSSTQRNEVQHHLTQQQPQGRIDISRMKIDGAERGTAAGPRPRSAPSACRSAGDFSRLSRTSSSHLARTVSQKLLQAEREFAQQKYLDAKELAPAPPFLAIAEPGVGIDTVRQNADALQASKAVKRTSYLKGYRPRATKWLARDTDVRQPTPQDAPDADGGGGGSGTRSALYSWSTESLGSAVGRKQRPLTAGNQRRGRSPLAVFGGSRSTPLLTQPERDFVFGKTTPLAVPAAFTAMGADDIESASFRPPSARRTTPGKMLRRAASAAGATTSRRRYQSRKPGSYCSTNTQMGSRRAFGSYLGGNFVPERVDSARNGRVMMTRPVSAAPGGRGRSCVTATMAPSRQAGSSKSMAEGATQHLGTRKGSSGPSGRPWVGKVAKRGTTLAGTSPTRDVLVEVRSGVVTGRGNAKDLKLSRLGRDDRPEMNVHQALKATLQTAAGSVTPRTQFVGARKLIAEMKQINTKDSIGDILLTTQGMSKKRIGEECWASESGRYVDHSLQ